MVGPGDRAADAGPPEVTTVFDYALGGFAALFLAAYLVYALLRPEDL